MWVSGLCPQAPAGGSLGQAPAWTPAVALTGRMALTGRKARAQKGGSAELSDKGGTEVRKPAHTDSTSPPVAGPRGPRAARQLHMQRAALAFPRCPVRAHPRTRPSAHTRLCDLWGTSPGPAGLAGSARRTGRPWGAPACLLWVNIRRSGPREGSVPTAQTLRPRRMPSAGTETPGAGAPVHLVPGERDSERGDRGLSISPCCPVPP